MGNDSWNEAYVSGDVPWDPGPYDPHLPRVLQLLELEPCRVLDVGCGTGGSLIYLAQRGFHCTGVDSAPKALEIAESRAQEAGVECRFLNDSFPSPFADRWDGEPFEFLIDRGFFHLHTGHAEQREFTSAAAELLSPGRPWYSLIASAKNGQGTGGPPRWSEADVRAAAGAQFRIEHLIETEFTPDEGSSMPAWIAVFRRAATST